MTTTRLKIGKMAYSFETRKTVDYIPKRVYLVLLPCRKPNLKWSLRRVNNTLSGFPNLSIAHLHPVCTAFMGYGRDMRRFDDMAPKRRRKGGVRVADITENASAIIALLEMAAISGGVKDVPGALGKFSQAQRKRLDVMPLLSSNIRIV